ncbi:MAG: hypothetical protein KJ615_06595, partial [Bacteroidetes bacterium]|nr:hypothetical protein [Bacteroidota bacterium]
MKKFELLRHFALISFAVGFLFVLSSCEKSITNSTSDEQDDVEKYDYVSSVDQQMAASLDSINVPGLPVCIATYLDSLPTEEISESELSTL